jgi:hypothetical protein
MLSNRFFQVFLGNQSSRLRRLNNGLPQCSISHDIIQPIHVGPTGYVSNKVDVKLNNTMRLITDPTSMAASAEQHRAT